LKIGVKPTQNYKTAFENDDINVMNISITINKDSKTISKYKRNMSFGHKILLKMVLTLNISAE